MTSFIHLRAHSDYSLGKSIIKIPDLINKAKADNMPALCLMDRGNLFGSLEFSMECLKNGIKPLIGTILKIDLEADTDKREPHSEIALIAKDQDGYQNLLELVSLSFLSYSDSQPHIKISRLLNYSKGLIALFNSFESPMAALIKKEQYKVAERLLEQFHNSFKENLFLELIRTEKNNWQFHEHWLLDKAFEKDIPIVATNPISFLRANLSEAHDALLCIANSSYILEDNRERSDPDHYFKNEEEMRALFSDLPEAIENTKLIALKSSVFPETRKPILPKFSHLIEDETLELQKQAIDGLRKRLNSVKYNINQQEYFKRLEFELGVINKMQFPGYFLIVSDFIKWSKGNGISVGPGRGSGAGSIVAWALEITDLDPIKFGLLFERFLNPERVSMPDFDIDFCQERRDEVINYVKDKYGAERVAQIITFGKLQARAVLRDVGRVMQIPYGLVDKICKMVPNNPANPITLSEAIALDKQLQDMCDDDPDLEKLLSISLELEGINRHVSTHAAGIIIADRPLIELVPLYMDSNSSMQTIQYSLKYADAAGLMKFDFLGLKTLTVISQTVQLIEKNRGIRINLANIDFEDKKTYQLLSQGHTVGIFQLEGAGMREAIKQLKPDFFGDVIALTSLYRPGPMDNIPSYVNRKHGLETPDYIHPSLENLLKETYGIIIYQEQVMELAQILAGYSLGEADLLRRAMGKKNKQEMDEQRAIFIERCIANEIKEQRAAEIFALIEKFASYGFNKSHAAAYAVITYQTAYLKTHYTAEFLTASMNLEIHDTSKIGMFCNDAKLFGIDILLPNINSSNAYFTVDGDKIRYGLAAIRGVGIKATVDIQEERRTAQFQNIHQFIERCHNLINKRAMENLIKAGTFDSLYPNRAELFANLKKLIRYSQSNKLEDQSQGSLFFDEENDQGLSLSAVADWEDRRKLAFEFEALGFYLSAHPLNEYQERLKKLGILSVENVLSLEIKNFYKCRVAGVVSSKKVKSSKRGKFAFLQITDTTGILDISIFNEKLLIESNDILQEGQTIICDIEIKNDENGTRMVAEKISEIHHTMKSTLCACHIYIKDKISIQEISTKVTDTGLPIKLYAELDDGSVVHFGLEKPLFIDYKGLEELKKIDNIRVVEQ
ncbi:MAG: DNA polymerase III subunit alpha [Candidatus Midichloria mitochondrii]|nr:DNA polymerase III subunit alpha [Candidatus Midichloria mitochondrii]